MSEPMLMVVDDDEDIRDTLQEILEDEGFGVLVARDGIEALELLRGGAAPRVILLDLMMPRMDGWEFAAIQRSDPALAEIPIVLLTADGKASHKAEQIRASAYLKKPVSLAELIAVVNDVMAG